MLLCFHNYEFHWLKINHLNRRIQGLTSTWDIVAKIYPDYIEDLYKPTEGEKRVFRFLKEAARPHNDFICWYEPPVGKSGKEPDFILFSKKHGLLIIEVKDWTSNQIVSINPHKFTILEGESQKKRTNPDKQAKGYVDALKQYLSKRPRNSFLMT